MGTHLANEEYREIVQDLVDVIVIIDSDGRFSWVSPQVKEVLGYDQEEVIGQDAFDFIHGDDLPNAFEGFKEALDTGEYSLEYRALHKDGHYVHLKGYGKVRIRGNDMDIIAQIRDISDVKEMRTDLKKIEWLLQKEEPDKGKDRKEEYVPYYGNVTDLNENGTIITTVGVDEIKRMTSDIMDLLDTSLAVYEKNGDYAFGMFASGWCQFMDASSRRLCGNVDNREALDSGKWHCHENCWNDSALTAIRTGEPTDIECIGGIHLYGVPIKAKGEVIGAINIGYGNPPLDTETLEKLSKDFGVDIADLRRIGQDYKPRPPFIVNVARNRLHAVAEMIGDQVERKMMEKELERSEKEFRDLFNKTTIGIFRTTSDGKILNVNPEMARILGCSSPEEAMDHYQDLSETLYLDPKRRDEFIEHLIERGEVRDFEYRARKKDGSVTWLSMSAKKGSKREDGTYIIEGFTSDITQRKEAEMALRKKNDFIQTILDNLPIGVATNSFDSGTADYINRSFQEIYGWPEEDLIDIESFFEKIYPDNDYREELQKKVMKDIKSGDVSRMHWEDLVATGKDGTKRRINAQNIPLIDQNTMVSTVWDVTKEKEAEREREFALERMEKRTEELTALLKGAEHVLEGGDFDTTARAIFDIARDMTGAMSGYVALLSDDGEENEVLFLESGGLPCDVNPELPMPIRGLRAESYRTGKAVYDNDFMNSEWVKFMPEGHVVMRNVMFSPLNIDGKTVGIMGLANKDGDFNEEDKRMAEAFGQLAAIALKNSRSRDALIESEERYRSIFDTAANLITSVDTDGIIVDCNERVSEILGYDKKDIIGQPMSMIIHPDFLEKAEESLEEILGTGISLDKTYKMMKKNGELIDVNINSSGLKGTNGRYFRTICIIEDVTQKNRMLRDLERSERRFKKARNRAELYLDLLSHDIGNLHQGIASFAQLADAGSEEDDPVKSFIRSINELAHRSQNLISNVKVLSSIKNREKDLNPLDIVEVLNDSIDVTRKMFTNESIRIDFDHPDESIMVDAEPIIQNIFVNLIHNGIKAQIGSVARIDVEIRREENNVIAVISDQGPGIPDKMKETIFERESMSRDRKHSGIGLSLVKELVNRYDGSITVQDRIQGDHSGGASFILSFPVSGN